MYLLILVIILIIVIIYLKKYVDKRNFYAFEHFKDNYNIEYDEYDKQYVDIFNIISNDKKAIKNDVKQIIKNLPKKNGKRILDLGCGVGHYTKCFKDNGFDVIGIDKSRNMLEKATVENPDCEFMRGNFIDSSLFDKDSQGLIFIGKHVLNQNKESEMIDIIQNCKKWIYKNGYLIVNIMNEKKEDIFPREYSQFYKNNNKENSVKTVSFTHFKNFRYDTWFNNLSNKKKDYYEKIVMKDGRYRINKKTLTTLPKTKLVNIFLKNNFIVKTVVKDRLKHQKDYMFIFQKK